MNSSSKISLQDNFWRFTWHIRGDEMSFPWDTHRPHLLSDIASSATQRSHILWRVQVEESTGNTSQTAKASVFLGGRARSYQMAELAAVSAVGPRAGWARDNSSLKEPEALREQPILPPQAWTGLCHHVNQQPHVTSFTLTCCSNGSWLKLVASLLWFHRTSLDTHVVYLNLVNHVCIFLGKKM